MKPCLRYYCVIFFLLLFVKSAKGQQVIDGSFEDNSVPSIYFGGPVDSNEFKKIKIFTPAGFELWGMRYAKSNPAAVGTQNWAYAPKGIFFLQLRSSSHKKEKLVLFLTKPLSINQHYILRWKGSTKILGSYAQDTVRVELGSHILTPTKEIFKHVPVSSTAYREYSTTFMADSNYEFLFFSQDTIFQGPNTDHAIIDDVILDTCVTILTKRTIGCAVYPKQLQTLYSGKRYLWNTGDTTPTVTAAGNGIYVAYIYDTLGCVNVDSIEVINTPVTSPSTFTLKTICAGDSTLLTSADTGTYTWNTGAFAQNISVKDSGIYWVHAVTAGGCDGIDSFKVVVQISPPLTLPIDTYFCKGSSVVINAYNPYFTVYTWNTGNTDSLITVNQSGLYKVTAANGLCAVTDSTQAILIDLPNQRLDTSLCAGDTVIITSGFASQYLWNTGTNTQSIAVTIPTTYWVTKTDRGCTSVDSFFVRSIEQPTSSLTTSFYCATQSADLTATAAQIYLWSTGEQTQSINITNEGLYTVQKNNEQCMGIDTFFVTERELPIITTPQDTTVCFDEVAQILLDAGHFKSYLWKPTGETTQTIYSTTAKVYLLTVTDSNNCSASKQVAVMETCPDFIYIPTAFTPNNDGLNDVFLPKTKSLESYELTIINRWGAIVFTTKNPLQGWDGKDAPAEVYVAQVWYSTAGKFMKVVSKNITLLR